MGIEESENVSASIEIIKIFSTLVVFRREDEDVWLMRYPLLMLFSHVYDG